MARVDKAFIEALVSTTTAIRLGLTSQSGTLEFIIMLGMALLLLKPPRRTILTWVGTLLAIAVVHAEQPIKVLIAPRRSRRTSANVPTCWCTAPRTSTSRSGSPAA